MANELSITYNGQTKTKDSGVVLNTAGRVMVTNMTITAAADPHTLYTPSSTYFKTGTSGAVSGASIPSNKYSSATYYVKAATPAFDGGTLSVNGTASATATNATLTSTNNSGIAIIASGTATPSRTSVLYNGAVAGWVSKSDNAVALNSGNGSTKDLSQTTYYVNSVYVEGGKTLAVTSDGTLTINKISGEQAYYTSENGYDEITYPIGDGEVYIVENSVSIDGVTVTSNAGFLITDNPSFIGGTLTLNGAATYTSSNISVSNTNSSGISVRPSAAFTPTRSSVLYANAVEGWVTKSNGATALAADAGSSVSLNGDTVYITGVTVPSGKTFTVNGGGDKGVKVEYKKVTVDTYPVTDTNGDLLVPTYSGTSLTYPAPGIFSDSASTTSMSIQGNVTVINGLTVKDVNAVPGSGTAPSDATYNYYLAKWQTAASLTTGPKVTISTSAPSGGSNGDIWYQVLS